MLCEKELCSGCAACAAACPINAITMQQDADGFYFPSIADNCIHCGKCERTCPVMAPKERPDRVYPKAFVMKHADSGVLKESASGGMFSLVSEWAFQQNGCIFGAVWDETFHVQLRKAENENEIAFMRGSKYVYSHAQNAYVEAKEELCKGRVVVFTGVPCQISGLYGYLGREYENLYTVEIPCHGAGSELVFDEYRAYIEHAEGKKLINLNQSSKMKPWTKLIRKHVAFYWNDGTVTGRDYTDDSYLSFYMQNVCLNEACFQCLGANVRRVADITMGDLMGYGVSHKHFLPGKDGVSAVWCNTEKGLGIISQLQQTHFALWDECSLQECMYFNHTLWRPTSRSGKRSAFFEEFHTMEYAELVDSFFNNKYHIIQFIKKCILKVAGPHLIACGMYAIYCKNNLPKRIEEQLRLLKSSAKSNS